MFSNLLMISLSYNLFLPQKLAQTINYWQSNKVNQIPQILFIINLISWILIFIRGFNLKRAHLYNKLKHLMAQSIQNIQKVNQQLAFRNSFLKHGENVLNFTQAKLFNNQRLLNALKKRNQTYNNKFKDEVLPSIPQSFRQLGQKVKKAMRSSLAKQIYKQNTTKLKQETISELGWQNFTLGNQKQYTQKYEQYLIDNIISSSMKNSKTTQHQIKGNLMKKLKGLRDQNVVNSSRKSNLKIDNQLKSNKQKYHQLIRTNVLTNSQGFASLQQFQHLNGQISLLWRIVAQYFRTFDYAVRTQKSKPYLVVVKAAIAMIQDQFKKQMPPLTHEKQLSDYMRKNYLINSKSSDYIVNQEGKLVWGIPYALYKAGAWPQFILALNNLGRAGISLRQEFTKFQDNLQDLNPIHLYFVEQPINDLFYQQLVAIAKGVSIYDERLCKLGSLDLVWLSLKSLKIYEDTNNIKKKNLQDVVQALQNFFLNSQQYNFTKQKYIIPYLHFLYLGAYSNIFKYKKQVNLGMKPDDYIHFLLVLQSKPQIMDQESYQLLLQTLQSQLISYISNLVHSNQQKQNAIFYILKTPKRYFKNVITTIFTSWNIFTSLNNYSFDELKGWKFIKFRYEFELSSEIFQDTIFTLFRNFIQSQKDTDVQLQIISSAEDLFEDPKNYFDLILLCLCRHLLRLRQIEQLALNHNPFKNKSAETDKFQNKKIYKKLNIKLKQTLQNFSQFKQTYGHIVKFLQNYCTLQDIQKQKNYKKLELYVDHQQYKRDLASLALKQDNYLKQLFEKLLFYNAADLFFIYINNLVHAKERIQYGRGKPDHLVRYKQEIKKYLNLIRRQRIYNIQSFLGYLDFERNWSE